MEQGVYTWDEKLFLALHKNHSEHLDSIMLLASDLLSYIPIIIIICILASRYYKNRSEHPYINATLFTIVLLTFSLFCLAVLPKVFSLIIYRDMPCHNPNISEWVRLLGTECMPSNSFFAMRPCVISCITTLMLFTIRQDLKLFKFLLILWCVLVSYSRVYLGVHYPLNVLVADATGFLVGFAGSRFYFYLKDRVLLF